ncbi:helix-turn-helix domain-containing protein [Microbulbifer aggregans]|uniref:helix-turn-helix domain-containing protein n=1 Tax=Microbulbifer aggregans TaxID=1769779 RepID=UPI001CFDD3F4|nr:AraC family transcriptional regulator [Microbulbifer aggregans]
MKAYIFNIPDVVLLMTAAECLLLAIFHTILPKRGRDDGRLLTAFLLIIAAVSSLTLVLWNDQFTLSPWFEQSLVPYLLLSAQLLKGPAIYLYFCSLTKKTFALNRKHALHLIPVGLVVLAMAVLGVTSADLRHLSTGTAGAPSEYAIELIWDLACIVPFCYALASLRLVRRYRKELQDEYSDFSEVELDWLSALTWGLLVSWGWTLLTHIVAKFSSSVVSDYMGIADNYVTFILINAFFAYSLTYAHQLLDTKPEESREPVNEDEPSEPAIAKVRNAMENERIYLKKNLNLEQFSERIDLPAKEVSSVINKHFGTNFFEFVNSYRVEAAKALLADSEKSDMTVLDVLLESGFNSKSAFHRFFSRLVGMSPTEYRKRAAAGTLDEGPTGS